MLRRWISFLSCRVGCVFLVFAKCNFPNYNIVNERTTPIVLVGLDQASQNIESELCYGENAIQCYKKLCY